MPANPASPVLPEEEAREPCPDCVNGMLSLPHGDRVPCSGCNGTGFVSPEAPSDDRTKHPSLCERCGERPGMARNFGQAWLCDPCNDADALPELPPARVWIEDEATAAEGRAEHVEKIMALVAVVASESNREGWWSSAPHMAKAADGCRDRAQKAREEIAERLARLRGSVSRADAQEDDKRDAERWRWFRQFLSVEDDAETGGQFLFIHDDSAFGYDRTFAPGFENTVESLVDRSRSTPPETPA